VETYTIRRRSAWDTPDELGAAGKVSQQVGEEMPDEVRWIRTYVVDEPDGKLGSICIYQASGPEAIKVHAERVGMPADEINLVEDLVLIQPDP
jgi:hypothetical protein